MALSRRRRGNVPEAPPSPQRRRRNRRRGEAEEVSAQSPVRTRATEERRRQRLAITIGAMLILMIIAIVAVGYYREFWEPPRVTAGEVRGVRFTMGDLVERIRVLQGINRYQGGFVDLSVVPFQYLQDKLNAEILLQAAPGLGITVTAEDIDEAVKRQFYPKAPEGQQVDPNQLEQEFNNQYTNFLTQVRLEEPEYRGMVSEQLHRAHLTGMFAASIPEMPPQVEVEWVRMDFQTEADPVEVRKRLDDEEFAAVAAEVGAPEGFADFTGYVGWVPEGAFPDLDHVIFGEEAQPAVGEEGEAKEAVEPLAVGAISDPIFLQDGIFIVHKLAGPEERELDPVMHFKLSQELVNEWRDEQLQRGSKDGWVKINFDSHRYAWVADQVRLTAPRVERPEQQNQGGLPVGGQ